MFRFLTKKVFLIKNVNELNKFSCVCQNIRMSLSTKPTDGAIGEINYLKGYLKSKILMKGPITIAEYMKEALGNPKWGYYMKNDVFGVGGDFITSPEVSQLFGELIGIWYLNEWMILKNIYQNDLPVAVSFIELGPGRGTLMCDILRVFAKHNQIAKDLHVYLVEMSPYLRQIQYKNLCNSNTSENDPPVTLQPYECNQSNNIKIVWLDDIKQLPEREAVHYYLANEFFDALPIHQFKKINNSYKEVLVDYDTKTDNLKFVVSPKTTFASRLLSQFHPTFSNFNEVELSIESASVLETIIKQLSESNGSALVIDYGHNGQCKDTFRAFKRHQLHDPLENPGNCDLTADVDFAFLKHIATNLGAACYGPVTQADFLLKMQIMTRLKVLLDNCKSKEERDRVNSECDMLTNKEKMGERFKFLAIRKLNFGELLPPGFETKPE